MQVINMEHSHVEESTRDNIPILNQSLKDMYIYSYIHMFSIDVEDNLHMYI